MLQKDKYSLGCVHTSVGVLWGCCSAPGQHAARWLPSRTYRQQPEDTENHSATRKAKQQASLKPKEQTECYWIRIALEKVRQSHSLDCGWMRAAGLGCSWGDWEEGWRKTGLGCMEGEGSGSLQAFKNSEDKYPSKMMLCMQLLLEMGRKPSRHYFFFKRSRNALQLDMTETLRFCRT